MVEAKGWKPLPHEFFVADEELRRILEEELTRRHASFRDIEAATQRYVDELFRSPGGRDELLRRAMVIPSLTAKGSQFDSAWADLKPQVIRWNRRLNNPDSEQAAARQGPVAHALRELSRNAAYSAWPLSLGEVEALIEALQSLLPRPRSLHPELRRLKRITESIWNEAKRSEAEGCQLLLMFGCDLYDDAIEADLREFRDGCPDVELMREMSKTTAAASHTLRSMKEAVASLRAWARSSGSEVPQPTEPNRQPSPVAEATHVRDDVTAVDAAEAIVFHGDNCVSVAGCDPFTVTESEGAVLESFIEHPAMDTAALKTYSGIDRGPAVLRKLTQKYGGILAPFMRLAGSKGKGGYSVRICRATKAP